MSRKKQQPRRISNIWLVTREYDGLAGAGGIKDVSRQLAEALAHTGSQVRVIMPLYGFINAAKLGFKHTGPSFEVDMPYVGVERQEQVKIWEKKKQQVSIYLVEADRFHEKQSIYTYTAAEEADDPRHVQGEGHYDYFAMNVLLQKAAIATIIRTNERPDVIHCQDGHTAILPAMIRENEGYRHYFCNTGVVVTIHNAGIGYHQEVGDLAFAQTITGLPSRIILNNQLNGAFDPLLAASSYAIMNTVSENYARELRETEDDELTGWLGHQLLEKGVILKGITNGINPADFDPAKPQKLGLPAGFSPEKGDFAGKSACRKHLVELCTRKRITGLKRYGCLAPKTDQPLFTLVGRFTEQKGVDKLLDVLEALLPMDEEFQVAIQGSGSRLIESGLINLADNKKYRGRVCLLLGFHAKLANLLYAAGDFFLIPSRYEPCGLTDYIAQLFGNIPIVHHIGGLVKVKDNITGFAYKEHSSAALMGTMQRAIKIFRENPDRINTIRKAAVQHIRKYYTWNLVMDKYLKLYQEALLLKEGHHGFTVGVSK